MFSGGRIPINKTNKLTVVHNKQFAPGIRPILSDYQYSILASSTHISNSFWTHIFIVLIKYDSILSILLYEVRFGFFGYIQKTVHFCFVHSLFFIFNQSFVYMADILYKIWVHNFAQTPILRFYQHNIFKSFSLHNACCQNEQNMLIINVIALHLCSS